MPALDVRAKRILLTFATLFVVGFACRLNGSSCLIWKELLHDRASPAQNLLGDPQQVRSDEWLVWTPALIAQTRLNFPDENPALGAGKAPFLYSLPVRSYTMIFRPQLWGFFVFDLNWGYAWYWNVKVFGLLASMFLLFYVLTRNSALSLFGTLWLFFSSYIQWWFSCPPMLPEMLAAWAVAVVSVIAICRSMTTRMTAVSTVMFVFGFVSFALCLYPPFQVPLIYLGAGIAAAHLLSSEDKKLSGRRMLVLLAAVACVAIVLTPFFFDIRPTLRILAQTSYPGARRSHGGEVNWMQLFSGLVSFFNYRRSFPEAFDSVNQLGNFVPLWIPVLALCSRDLMSSPRRYAVAWVAAAIAFALTVYSLFPLPRSLCAITLLSTCTGTRALLTIGVANVTFVVVTAPLVAQKLSALSIRTRSLFGAVCIMAIALYLRGSSAVSPVYFANWRLLLFVGGSAALIAFGLSARLRLFASAFVGLLVASNAFVNPLMTGLDPLARSTATAPLAQLVAHDPQARWIAYESSSNSQLLVSLGANVISGTKTVPDLAFYSLLDEKGEHRDVYNQYGIGYFMLRHDRASSAIADFHFPIRLVSVHPLHPAMRAYNVRYFLFPKPLRDPASEGMELVCAVPENELWAYRTL